MARKTLLNEQEIRKFLKLANITTVGDQKIEEMGGSLGGAYDRDDEDELEGDTEIEVGADEIPAEDPMAAPEEAALDADPELDIDAAEDDLGTDALDVTDKEALMADVVQAVAQALGIEDRVDIEAGEEASDDLAGDLGEPALDLEPEAELAPEEGGEASLEEPVDPIAADEEEEEEIPVMETIDEDAIVSEVARRVAKRLQDETSKEAVVDKLAERILKRLTK